MLSSEQYEKDAAVLREAMKGWGTNEESIIKLVTSRSNADRQEILKFYKSSFGRDLIEDLADELGGEVKKVVIGMFRTPVDYDCYELQRAMKGVGTQEEVLIEIIGSRPTSTLKQIKERYLELFKVDLEKEVEDECGSDLKRLLISLLQCNRSETTNIDEGKLDKDVKDIYEAGEGTLGTDESVFNKIFTNRSPAELRFINEEYYKLCGKSLAQVIESEFGGDIARLLKTVLHSILNPADFFACKIREACKGMGTNDDQLIRILISRDEIDLKQIKEIYKQRFEKTLFEEIKDETGGDYKNLLLGIARND
jgi:hypothetical protein